MKATTDTLLKLSVLALILMSVFHVFFRFASDLQWADAPGHESPLTSWEGFERRYLDQAESVHVTRFAANHLVHGLARGLDSVLGASEDVRNHPLRYAAALLVSAFTMLMAALVMFSRRLGAVVSWPIFTAFVTSFVLASLHSYQTYDVPAYGFIVLASLAVLSQRWGWALALVVVGGLFRETMLHVVALAAMIALVGPTRRRWVWAAALAVCWFAQWYLIQRVGFPETRSSFDPGHLLRGWGSLALAQVVLLAIVITAALALWAHQRAPLAGLRGRFAVLSIIAIPAWLLFYKASGGNLAELRMLIPLWVPFLLLVSVDPIRLEQLLTPAPASDLSPAGREIEAAAIEEAAIEEAAIDARRRS